MSNNFKEKAVNFYNNHKFEIGFIAGMVVNNVINSIVSNSMPQKEPIILERKIDNDTTVYYL